MGERLWFNEISGHLHEKPEKTITEVIRRRCDTPIIMSALLTAYERPDMENWDRIVDEHGPFVFRLARRILGPGSDAEDVVQEAFLEVFQFGYFRASHFKRFF